jgi:hypothetical protein
MGRLPENLLPLQSGVGNIANAVLGGLRDGGFTNLTAFTEVIQDGMLDLIRTDTIRMASATALSLSPEGVEEFARNIDHYRERIVLRPQEISNHAELVRRLGCIGINGMVEADLYGNVNSTMWRARPSSTALAAPATLPVTASCPALSPPAPPRTGRFPASCPWSAMSTTPSTTSASSLPSRAWPTCAACRPSSARAA